MSFQELSTGPFTVLRKSVRMQWVWTPPPGSGQFGVVVLGGELPVLLGQVRVGDRLDDPPLLAGRADLVALEAEAHRFERRSGDPQRGEEMAPAAAGDRVATIPE